MWALLTVITVAATAFSSLSTAMAAITGVSSSGSIVFIKGNNVWLTSPDGAVQRQVTTDGTAAVPYQEPSQSDDGSVIVAAKFLKDPVKPGCCGFIFEMNRQGVLLRPAFPPPQFTPLSLGFCSFLGNTLVPAGFLGAVVSPDGTKIAYSPRAFQDAENSFPTPSNPFAVFRVNVINLDGTEAVPTLAISPTDQDFTDPSWVGSSRLLVQHQVENAVYTYDLGSAAPARWFGPKSADDNAASGPVLRATKLATLGMVPNPRQFNIGSQGIRLWTLNGAPPAAPSARCDFFAGSAFTNASWAPDGNAVVWEGHDTIATNNPLRDDQSGPGIYILPVGDIGSGTCPTTTTLQLLIPNGASPYWGPAQVNPVGPVDQAPAITSANATSFTVGVAGTFTVVTTGSPVPTLAESGALPSGVTFDPATGILSGTPAAAKAGTYPLAFTASNGVGTPASQGFTLTVNPAAPVDQAPAITSAKATSFTVGVAGTFTVVTTGSPVPTLAESGALPSGVTFDPATGILSGTPAAATAGTYPLTFTATNGVTPNDTQRFTVTVKPALPTAADVSLRMTADGDDFGPHSRASYRLVVTNRGGVATSSLTVTDPLPGGMVFKGASGKGWTCGASGPVVTCSFNGSLKPRGRTRLTLFVSVSATKGSRLVNTATVTPLDLTPGDNTATVTVTVPAGDESGLFQLVDGLSSGLVHLLDGLGLTRALFGAR